MRLARALLLVMVLTALPAEAPAQIGRKLEEVRGEDFWTHFDFQPVWPARVIEYTTFREFRPGAERFAPLVRLMATLDGDGRIREMEMTLSRAFVDDPADGVFARDVAKSFLRAAMPADDLPDVETLANEIELSRADSPGTAAVRRSPAIPAEPTPPYRVYLGQAAEWSRTLEASTIRLRNGSGEGGPVLVLTVSARRPSPFD